MANKIINSLEQDLALTETPESSFGQNEEVFKILVDTVEDYAIFALDTTGRILTWNKGAERLKGYKAHEIVGEHFSKFYTQGDIDRKHPEEELKIAISEGRFVEEGWRIKKDGQIFWANVVITKLMDHHGKHIGFAKVTRDLTEKKLIEEKLRGINDELEKQVASRTQELETALKARESFLSIASHELKTPLTSLKLKTQMRVRTFSKKIDAVYNATELIEMFESDERQIGRLTRLVDDILDTTRIDAGKLGLQLEEIELCELIQTLAKDMLPALQTANCEISFTCTSPAKGQWDSYRLEQVFINLMTNAMRYGQGYPIHISAGTKNNAAYFSIKDHGIGISDKDQDRIFHQFERATNLNEGKGLGLGLYIVKQIVLAHNGKIHLTSSLGKGSEFTVELPLP